MRIAIAGASGTGKTTLARAISDKYQIPINPVGARSVAFEMGFDNPYDVDRDGRRAEFQERLFEAKRAWEREHEHFVTDRSYFDNLSYCALHMAQDLAEDAIDVYAQAMRRYDLVFLLHARTFQDLGDGVRLVSPGYHKMYEFVLDSLMVLSKFRHDGVTYRTLGSILELRTERALGVIDGMIFDQRIATPPVTG